MKFTYQELARLNQMIGIAFMSGKIEFDEVSESVHQKVALEICKRVQEEIKKDPQEFLIAKSNIDIMKARADIDRERETDKEVV